MEGGTEFDLKVLENDLDIENGDSGVERGRYVSLR
jgi:hypothetical protein